MMRGLGLWTSRLAGGLALVLRLVVLGERLEGGEGGLVGLEGLEGGEKWLGSMGLLGRMYNMDLVLVILRRRLRGHVEDVVDLR